MPRHGPRHLSCQSRKAGLSPATKQIFGRNWSATEFEVPAGLMLDKDKIFNSNDAMVGELPIDIAGQLVR